MTRYRTTAEMRGCARLVSLGLLVLAWEVGAQVLHNPVFTPASRVVPAALQLLLSGELLANALVSLGHVATGLLLAVLGGVGAALILSRYRLLGLLTAPAVDALRPISAISIFPLFLLTLGITAASKIAVVLWTAYPIILLAAMHAFLATERQFVEAAEIDGATAWQALIYIALPLATPQLLNALRIAVGSAWMAMVAAEMLGSSSGLGYAVLGYSQSFQFPEMYATVLTTAALGLTMSEILFHLHQRSLAR